MKKLIYALYLFFVVPLVSKSQPVISTNEFYHIGDVVQMTNCQSASVNAGAPGANVVWDFSSLVSLGGVSTTSVAADTSTVFLTCNLLIILPDGKQVYMQESSSDSYIDGIEDPDTHIVTNYSNLDFAKRPFTYNSTYVDTYRVIITTPFTHGTGIITENGDAYGKLILPTGTYNNILRIRKMQVEEDTTGSSGAIFNTTISYLWFDNSHTAPLFRIDSFSGTSGTANDAMYLAVPSGIQNQSLADGRFTGCFSNGDLLLTGAFIAGRTYELSVADVAGRSIFKQDFTAVGSSQQMEIGTFLSPGIYIVAIYQPYEPSSRQVIKVAKY